MATNISSYMAQQVGALRFKGKVGNVVGFGNSASEKVNKNFVRQQASSVANPKTYKQAEQRSKVKPAAAFYSAFENVLNHAFLPSQRASKNRNMFMKKAMILGAIPDVRRDDNYLPVVPYQISEGNLGLDYLTQKVQADDGVFFNIVLDLESIAANTTLAALSTSILGQTPQLEEGEEITFLAIVSGSNDLYVRRAVHVSFVLNTSDTITTVGDVTNGTGLTLGLGDNSKLGIFAEGTNAIILAAGCIISSKTNASWRYTKSYMYLSDAAISLPNIEDEVILSYMSAETSATSDKILQQANNQANATVHIVSLSRAALTNAPGYTGDLTPAYALVAVYNNGVRKVVVTGSWVVATITEQGTNTIVYRGDQTPEEVTLESTQLAGNATVEASEVFAAGFYGNGQ